MLLHTAYYSSTESQKFYKRQVSSRLIHNFIINCFPLIILQESSKLKTFHMFIQISFKYMYKHIMGICGVEILNNISLMFIFINKSYHFSHFSRPDQLICFHSIQAHLNAAKP
jgi:hypothetical protein